MCIRDRDLAILVDTSRYHLLDRIESLFDQVGILDPENHYRISVRTFLKNILDGNAGDTCIGLEPITIDLLPSLRFHCDHDGDIGIHHPLTENEITQHSNSLDISCPIGRKSICHYSDFVSYISTNLNVELSRAKSKFFRKQLRQLLNIPQPILSLIHISEPTRPY